MRRLTVSHTLPLVATAPGAVCDDLGGFGVVAHQRGQLDLPVFWIIDSDLCGVVVGGAPGSAIDLASGVISGAVVGACVQLPGYDTSRLRNVVDYVDVQTPLQATSYTLPDPPEPF